MESIYPKSLPLRFAIPGDLHLCGRLRLDSIREIRAYFDEQENDARKVLEAEEWLTRPGGKAVKQEVLDRMQRIAYVIVLRIKAGRNALEKNRKADAEGFARQIPLLKAELFSEPDRARGIAIKQAVSQGGKAKAKDQTKRRGWLDRAERLKRDRPDLSDRSLATLIAKKTGDNFETIRKAIRDQREIQDSTSLQRG